MLEMYKERVWDNIGDLIEGSEIERNRNNERIWEGGERENIGDMIEAI